MTKTPLSLYISSDKKILLRTSRVENAYKDIPVEMPGKQWNMCLELWRKVKASKEKILQSG